MGARFRLGYTLALAEGRYGETSSSCAGGGHRVRTALSLGVWPGGCRIGGYPRQFRIVSGRGPGHGSSHPARLIAGGRPVLLSASGIPQRPVCSRPPKQGAGPFEWTFSARHQFGGGWRGALRDDREDRVTAGQGCSLLRQLRGQTASPSGERQNHSFRDYRFVLGQPVRRA